MAVCTALESFPNQIPHPVRIPPLSRRSRVVGVRDLSAAPAAERRAVEHMSSGAVECLRLPPRRVEQWSGRLQPGDPATFPHLAKGGQGGWTVIKAV